MVTFRRTLTGCCLLFLIMALSCTAAHCQTPHGIVLTWTQSTGSSITANTVYSAPTLAGPFTLLKVLSPSTTYEDLLTASNGGTSRCYEVTATASGMDESAASSPVCLTFPLLTPPVTGLSGNTN